MKGGWQLTVNRPVTEVFDFLADIRNETAWNPRVKQIEKESGGPITMGTIFRGHYKALGTLVTEVTAYERPTRLSFQSTGERMHLRGTFTLTPVGSGTSVALSAELQPGGLFAVVAPLMTPLITRQNAVAARRLKAALDEPRSTMPR